MTRAKKSNATQIKTKALRENKRSAGILMHITSLPGKYGIGDLGFEAKHFADFLFRSGQTLWQLLPLNPVEAGSGYSPYSSISSMAGNTLLINLELLSKQKWLSKKDLSTAQLPSQEKVNFKHAEKIKDVLLEKAFINFIQSNNTEQIHQFNNWCTKEKIWLNDFALYVVLKKHHQQKPWYNWPDEYKFKDLTSLASFSRTNKNELLKMKWLQYIFFMQWTELKSYCNERSIRMVGDLPFYVSYDSADVWSFPEIFSLDKKGNLKEVAGVPPDYFNSDGQLWGMPVFKWDILKKQRYGWWINRIRKNLQLFDLIRLDHFRAFADFWAVPSGEKTAINGQWKRGPGAELFETLQQTFGVLPFLAEDLGDINDGVHKLRTGFFFPGMKVLQFAFGDNMPQSEYIPHNYKKNYAVYTGTHDNNTTRGWYRKDATATERENLAQYFIDQRVTDKNIHLKLIQLAYASVAIIAIIPGQDLLGLDEKSRMNTPASTNNNWLWRMLPGALATFQEEWLKKLTLMHNRNSV